MQPLTRTHSAPFPSRASESGASAAARPPLSKPAAKSPAYMRLVERLSACEAALVDKPSEAERREATLHPRVDKEQVFNHGWFGALSRTRRAQRRDIASGVHTITMRQRVAFASGAIAQFATINLSFLLGPVVLGGKRVLKRRTRTDDGVREEKVLSLLTAMSRDIDDLRIECARLAGGSGHFVCRERCRKVSQRFDALEAAVTSHPSERLRGSPSLRNKLADIATDLGRIDPLRPRRPVARFRWPGKHTKLC